MKTAACVKLPEGCRPLNGQSCDGCPLRLSPKQGAMPTIPKAKPFGNRCSIDGTAFDEGGICSHGHQPG